jgi:hypothetical protein
MTTPPHLSLCVGVTGHLDIDPAALPRVRELVAQAFDTLEARFGLDFVVFSSLAEGADRVVAEVALARGRPARVIAALPLPADEYEKVFATPESKDQFRQLLDRADDSFVVEPDGAPRTRVESYRRARLHVAHACHVLLALSDDEATGEPACSWEIIKAKEAGESQLGQPDFAAVKIKEPRGVVVRVRTPRALAPDAVVPGLVWPDEKGRAWQALVEMCSFTARMNEDGRKGVPDLQALFADPRSSARKMKQHPPGAPPKTDRLIDLCAVADRLAVVNQRWVRGSWMALYTVTVLAVFAYGVYAHGEGHRRLVLLAYLSLLVLSLVAFVVVRCRGWHGRFIDYRGLAEGLRVAVFWRIAGLTGDPVDRYPANLTGEVEWVRMTLRSETARCEPKDPGAARTADTLAYVIREWVDDQAAYFEKTGKADTCKEWWCRLVLAATLVLSAAIAVALLVDQRVEHEVFEWALVAIALVPAIGAAVAGYAVRRGYGAQSRQYQRMLDLFQHARMILDSLKSDDAKREVLSRLAGEALAEHAQWVVLHRERPFEFVGAGP